MAVFNSNFTGNFCRFKYFSGNSASYKLPSSTAEFGDSLGVLNSLFSSLAVILALAAVIMQGKELKESTAVQNHQTKALIEQLSQQTTSNRINTLSIRLQYLMSETERLQLIMAKIAGDFDKEELFNNCNRKKKRLQSEAEEIDSEMKSLLLKT